MARALDVDQLEPLSSHQAATVLDRETVQLVAEHFAAGIFQPPANINQIIEDADQDEFDRIFAGYLGSSPLSASAPVTSHRALALERTLMQLVADTEHREASQVTTAGLVIAEADLQTYLELNRPDLDILPPAVRTHLLSEHVYVTPEQLAKMLQVSTVTVANWRNTSGGGPRYVKLHGKRPSIRYPVMGVLEWIRSVEHS